MIVHREGEHEGRRYILERFDTIDEFIKEMESRPIADDWKGTRTAENIRTEDITDPKFRSVHSYSEAKKKFIEGTKAAAEMSKAFASEVDPKQREKVNSPVGCVPIVASALMGLPNSMIDIRRKRIPKAVRLVVDMTVHCGISCYDITRAGKQIIAAIGKLESQGISTEIVCSVDSSISNMFTSMGVIVKTAGQAFNAARVSFPMSSPAFLRVWSFIQTSSLEGLPYDSGYGRAVSYVLGREELDAYYKKMYGPGIHISLANVISRGEREINNAIEAWKNGR